MRIFVSLSALLPAKPAAFAMERGSGLIRAAALILAIITLCFAQQAHALSPEATLENPRQEKRAQELFVDLRCAVCEGQSLKDSDALLARDMRSLIREQIKEGKSNKAITEYLVARYGQQVVMKPPMRGDTSLLWYAPFLMLIAGIAIVLLATRQKKR